MDTPEELEKGRKEDMVVAHIPEEIIVQILSRLPVKSLLRFKSVCKVWQSLLSDPQFSWQTKGREVAIFCYAKPTDHLKRNLFSLDHQCSIQEIPRPFSHAYSYRKVDLLCSCNGLVLVCIYYSMHSDHPHFLLWNPSTRSCRPLPELTTLINYFHSPVAYGLCFDESTDDYRAVMVYNSSSTWQTGFVASLSSRIKLADVSILYMVAGEGVLANGHLHWIDELWEIISGDDWIVCFDGMTNKFEKLPIPEQVHEYDDRNKAVHRLGVLDGCLCMSRYGRDSGLRGFRCEIFIMREYGVKESWTNLCVISGGVTLMSLCGWKPLFSTKPGEEFLITSSNHVLAYNVKTKSLKEIRPYPRQEIYAAGLLMYEESLTSVYF